MRLLEENPEPRYAATAATITHDVARVIVRIIAGWRPTPFSSAVGESFSWNDGEIESTTLGAHEEGGSLFVQTAAADIPFEKFLASELRNKPCRGRFSSDQSFTAQLAHATRLNDKAHFECFYWSVSSDARKPHLWVAPLAVIEDPWLHFANGAIRVRILDPADNRPRHSSRHVLHLQGQYAYFLLLPEPNTTEGFLIFDTADDAPPNRAVLHREFLAIQYVLGQALRLNSIVGVDHNCRVVAHAGGPYGTLHKRQSETAFSQKSPIAAAGVDIRTARVAGHHAAALFSSISAAERDHPEFGLRAAMTFYLTSLGEYLEGAALKLHVALEGLASKLFEIEASKAERQTELRTSKALYLTTWHNDWKSWCNQNAGAIRAMSRPDVKDAILDAVRRADRPGASNIVPTMLKHFEIPLTDDIIHVLAARNELVHEARLPDEENVDRSLLHESVPRTLLAALVSKAVGYGGPIRGYDGAPPGWWSVSPPPAGDETIIRVLTVEFTADEWLSQGSDATSIHSHIDDAKAHDRQNQC